MEIKDLDQPKHKNTWCPGCGDFGILASLKKALAETGKDPKDTVIVSGIGCSSKAPHYVKTYGFEGVHGRVLPVSQGIKLANHKLNVIGVAGDGDGYGIGTAHFVHTLRRNMDLCYIVFNNEIYALTKNQYSPTTEKGHISSTSPHGAIETPLHALAVAIASGATFVARSYAMDLNHLSDMIKQGMAHKGIAFIDVIQPCVSWRKDHSMTYLKERIYDVNKEGHDTSDKANALKYLIEEDLTKKIGIGLFYKEEKSTYYDEIALQDKSAVSKQAIDKIDVEPLLSKFE